MTAAKKTHGAEAETRTAARTPWQADVAVGLVAAIAGAVVISYAFSMPTLGEGRPGPGLFPGIIGGLLALFGLGLAVRSWWSARRGQPGDVDSDAILEAIVHEGSTPRPDEEDAARAAANDDARTHEPHAATVVVQDVPARRLALNAVVVIASVVGYIVLADTLGFLVTMTLVAYAVMVVLNYGWLRSAVYAVATSVALWALFERGLRVQLPDGVLGV